MNKKESKRQPQRPANDDFREPSLAREIVLSVDLETYSGAIEDNEAFRVLLADCYARYPEWFPPEFDSGFHFKDSLKSACTPRFESSLGFHHKLASASSSTISTRMGSHNFTAPPTASFAFSTPPTATELLRSTAGAKCKNGC